MDSSDDEEDVARVELNDTIEEIDDELFDSDVPSLILTLAGALVTLDIEIQEYHVYLRKVRAPTAVNIQDLTGKPMSPFQLVKVI